MDFIMPNKFPQGGRRILSPQMPLPGHQLPRILQETWWTLRAWPYVEPQLSPVFLLPHSQLHLQVVWRPKGLCLIGSKAPSSVIRLQVPWEEWPLQIPAEPAAPTAPISGSFVTLALGIGTPPAYVPFFLGLLKV